MGMIVTTAGLQLLARLNAENKKTRIDKMIYAFRSGVNSETVPNLTETIPSNILYTDNFVKSKYVDSATVVYTSVLDSSIGDFEFNWMGLFCSEHNILVAVSHTNLQEKIASKNFTTGNFLAKNIGIGITNAKELLSVTIEAGSGDVDFRKWLEAADGRLRLTNVRLFGDGLEQESNSEILSGGFCRPFTAWVGGIRINNSESVQLEISGTAGEEVYLEAWIDNRVLDSTVNWRLVAMSANSNISSIYDGFNWHYFIKIAEYVNSTTFKHVFTSVYAKNLVRFASQKDVNDGGAKDLAISPETLKNCTATMDRKGVVNLATTAEILARKTGSDAVITLKDISLILDAFIPNYESMVSRKKDIEYTAETNVFISVCCWVATNSTKIFINGIEIKVYENGDSLGSGGSGQFFIKKGSKWRVTGNIREIKEFKLGV